MQREPTITLLIATYNWVEALELVLLSLLEQTEKPFEVIIADDGSTDKTKELIIKYKSEFTFPLIHVWHEDKGFRLAKIRNEAIKKATGNYIIQIDGDIILHKDFIKDHKKNATPGFFISGSRVLLGKDISTKLLQAKKTKKKLFEKDITNSHYAYRIPPLTSLLKKPSDDVQKVIRSVRGCNMSFWKDDLVSINGYDEDMMGWGREDSEISARLINYGLSKINLKFCGIQYHIYHPTQSREGLNTNDIILEQTIKNKSIYAENGIEKSGITPKKSKLFLTAIIPTLNEEHNVKHALKSVGFADEILVIDSFSTDKTVSIAEQFGAKVIQREFDDFSSQKNFAINAAKNDWIFILDADERATDSLQKEIQSTLKNENKADAYWIFRQNFFLNKKIRFSGWQNDKVIRLFNKRNAQYNGKIVHEEIECNGKIGYLNQKIEHYTYHNYEEYKSKITLYSKLKAKEIFDRNSKPNLLLFAVKPYYRFFYHYILKLGIFDGKSGLIIASVNMYGAKLKYQELKKLYKNK